MLFEAEDFLRVGSADGNFILGLHKGAPHQVGAKGVEIALEVDDVDRWHAELSGVDVHFTLPPRNESWGARHANFEDPDGYKLTIFTPLR